LHSHSSYGQNYLDVSEQAAQEALLRNQSTSGFIARRVALYMEQIRCLTVPELKQLALRHKLDGTGTKSQLRIRLSVWVRDEVADGTKDLDIVDPTDTCIATGTETKADDLPCPAFLMDEASDDETASTSSDEELELIGEESDRFSFLCSDGSEFRSSCDGKSKSLTDSIINDEVSQSLDVNEDSEPSIHTTLKKLFGYDKLRGGQEWAIRRCLNRQRSLLVAPTGFGKSLCYTLPAAMMDGVCIVVSPLLSLIHDQIRMIPARLAAATLSGPMSTANVAATLDDIVRGRIKLLFVSPERLTSSSFRRLFRPTWNALTNNYERFFPEVSLFCVDEAHCMSQWAHNFRPSYLRLRSIIDIIEPRSVLAITATAGPKVIDDICRTLKIEQITEKCKVSEEVLHCTNTTCGVRVSKTNRDNIDVKCLFLDTQEERLSKVRAFA
jgi:hypothetical protein